MMIDRTDPLPVVKQAKLLGITVHDARPHPVYAVSVDEKPGIQAIGLTAPDLSPVVKGIHVLAGLRIRAPWHAVALGGH